VPFLLAEREEEFKGSDPLNSSRWVSRNGANVTARTFFYGIAQIGESLHQLVSILGGRSHLFRPRSIFHMIDNSVVAELYVCAHEFL